ncbi:MAG TPA: hypothetical protein VIQ31_12355 [Phormidium sp.]
MTYPITRPLEEADLATWVLVNISTGDKLFILLTCLLPKLLAMYSIIELPQDFEIKAAQIACAEIPKTRFFLRLLNPSLDEPDNISIDFKCFPINEYFASQELSYLSFLVIYNSFRYILELCIIPSSVFTYRYTFNSSAWLDEDDEVIDFSHPLVKNYENIAAKLFPLFANYFFRPSDW